MSRYWGIAFLAIVTTLPLSYSLRAQVIDLTMDKPNEGAIVTPEGDSGIESMDGKCLGACGAAPEHQPSLATGFINSSPPGAPGAAGGNPVSDPRATVARLRSFTNLGYPGLEGLISDVKFPPIQTDSSRTAAVLAAQSVAPEVIIRPVALLTILQVFSKLETAVLQNRYSSVHLQIPNFAPPSGTEYDRILSTTYAMATAEERRRAAAANYQVRFGSGHFERARSIAYNLGFEMLTTTTNPLASMYLDSFAARFDGLVNSSDKLRSANTKRLKDELIPQRSTPFLGTSMALVTALDRSTNSDETIPIQYKGSERDRLLTTRSDLSSTVDPIADDIRKAGLRFLKLADSSFDSGAKEAAEVYLSLAMGCAELALNMHPITGPLKGLYEFITGRSLFTGEVLSDNERMLAGLSVVTLGILSSIKNAGMIVAVISKESRIPIGVSQKVMEFRGVIGDGVLSSRFPGADAVSLVDLRSADSVNETLKFAREVVQTPVAPRVLARFEEPFAKGTMVAVVQAEKEVEFVRVHGEANKIGKWLIADSDLRGLDAAAAKLKLNTPSVPTRWSVVRVPKGSLMYIGGFQTTSFGVASDFKQIYAPQLVETWIKSTRPFN